MDPVDPDPQHCFFNVLLRIWLGTFADDLFIIHLIVNITSSREEGERQEQEQGNAHVHPAPRTVFISVSSNL